MGELDGKVAIVTGAGRERGIGVASAREMARRGAAVMLTDLARPAPELEFFGWPTVAEDMTGLEAAVAEIVGAGGSAAAMAVDVRSEDEVKACVEATVERFGTVDILFANAGTPIGAQAFFDLDDNIWEQSWRINVMGTVYAARAVLPIMQEKAAGSIIINSSTAGLKVWPDFAAYSATKFAAVALTKSLATDFGKHGIRVNAVCPGDIDTQMGDIATELMLQAGLISEDEKHLTSPAVAIGRKGIGADVAEVVASMTGIPVKKLAQEETEKLLRMEDELRKRVVGQEEALTTVSRAVRRNRAGLRDPRRPIGSFIFLGPTGVGKTELARTLAGFMFEDENALIRLDMSEYMERFAVSRLVGAPPGYVGYDEGGQLTEKVRRRPYSVVLFDEIEKAHPDVFNILLQVLEDGQLTDSFGRTVDFRNTVVIMTSNVGARDLAQSKGIGFAQEESTEDSYAQMKGKATEALKRVFNPEFLNRVDGTVVFRALGMDEMGEIIDILLRELQERVKEADVSLKISAEAKELLIEKGFDPAFGARPLRRAIQRYLEDPLSEQILTGKFGGGSIAVERKGDELTFRKARKKVSAAK